MDNLYDHDLKIEFNAFVDRVRSLTGARTQIQLANILDVRQSSIADAKRRGSIPPEWLLKLYDKYRLNPDWLRTGEGSRFLKPDENAEVNPIPFEKDLQEVFRGTTRAAAAVSRVVRLSAACLGMIANNMHSQATGRPLAYGVEAFEEVANECESIETNLKTLSNLHKITTTEGPEHGGHAEAQETQTPSEAPAEGSLQQD